MVELKSGSERFCVPKTSLQENILVIDAVPASSIKTSLQHEHFSGMAEDKRG